MKKHDLWDIPDMHDKKIGLSGGNLFPSKNARKLTLFSLSCISGISFLSCFLQGICMINLLTSPAYRESLYSGHQPNVSDFLRSLLQFVYGHSLPSNLSCKFPAVLVFSNMSIRPWAVVTSASTLKPIAFRKR